MSFVIKREVSELYLCWPYYSKQKIMTQLVTWSSMELQSSKAEDDLYDHRQLSDCLEMDSFFTRGYEELFVPMLVSNMLQYKASSFS